MQYCEGCTIKNPVTSLVGKDAGKRGLLFRGGAFMYILYGRAADLRQLFKCIMSAEVRLCGELEKRDL